MCRSCNEGQKRCKSSDSSEKRRLRRKAAKAKEAYKATAPNRKPKIVEPKIFASVQDIIEESAAIKEVLHTKPLQDEAAQDVIDNEIEKRVTALGLAISSEAEKRAEFNVVTYKATYDATSEDLEEATMSYMDSEEAVNEATEALENAKINESTSPEELSKLEEAVTKAEAERDELEAKYNEASEADDARREVIHSEQIEKLTSSYISVLSEIRELGGNLEVGSDSDAKGVALLQDSVGKVYPSDWVTASNIAGDSMRLKIEDTRSHYMDSAEQKDFNADEHPDAITQASSYYIFPLKKADATTLVETIGGESEIYDGREVLLDDSYKRIVKIPVKIVFDPETHPTEDGMTPSGEGWKQEYYIDKSKTLLPEKVWVKEDNVKKVMRPEMILSIDKPEKEQKALAYHEFAHRVETVVAGGAITRMEEAWLRRRTTNVDTGIREDNSKIYPSFTGNSIIDIEFGRRNSFFTHYVGKEYPTNRHREVLSMGAEALFGGAWSGLMGIDGSTKADHDHKAFVLGIFATA